MNIIETKGLTKYYGKARGILDMDLTVQEGDFFGFIGPNGAGKSTAIRILLGLISPTKGSAKIMGKDILTHPKEILSETGYMPSESAFYNNMKVKDLIRLSADFRKKDCAAESNRLCERLLLDRNKKICELSLGNRKKASIVCALQHMPRLCILDEPTNGLDPLIQREFYKLLQERNKQGATIFLSSHALSEVQKYCKHAAVIREGKLLVSDQMDRLGHTQAKRVVLRGVTELSTQLCGIKDIQTDSEGIRFLYSGNLKTLLTFLAPLPITDISITEPDLEEIFIHYYE